VVAQFPDAGFLEGARAEVGAFVWAGHSGQAGGADCSLAVLGGALEGFFGASDFIGLVLVSGLGSGGVIADSGFERGGGVKVRVRLSA